MVRLANTTRGQDARLETLITAVVLLAGWQPARRAARAEPTAALRAH